MSALEERAAVLGARAVARVRARVAAEVARALPGIAATSGDEGVILAARGLRARFLGDARLRWVRGLIA